MIEDSFTLQTLCDDITNTLRAIGGGWLVFQITMEEDLPFQLQGHRLRLTQVLNNGIIQAVHTLHALHNLDDRFQAEVIVSIHRSMYVPPSSPKKLTKSPSSRVLPLQVHTPGTHWLSINIVDNGITPKQDEESSQRKGIASWATNQAALRICDLILRSVGGRVVVGPRDDRQKGTRFSFDFPYTVPTNTEETEMESNSIRSDSHPRR